MLNKLAGFSAALLSTIICFISFKLFIHKETDIQLILEGTFFIILYASPFIILGILLTALVPNNTSKIFNMGIYTLLGFVISVVVIMIFKLYHSIDVTIFLVVTCIFGSISFKFGNQIKNKTIAFAFATVIPLAAVIFLIFV